VDAPYPGSGSGQACGFVNPYYLWTNDPPVSKAADKPVWKIAGGDTVIIKNGDYRMGGKSPDANGWWNFAGCRGNLQSCYNPPIPPGTAETPTRIAGEEWATGCAVKPILRGVAANRAVLNLNDAQYVSLDCLEITDAAQCRLATLGAAEPYPCVFTKTDHAYAAIQTNERTQHISLTNLFIHGMGSTGLQGPIGGHIEATNIHLRGNGNLGWNFDPGNLKTSYGPLTIRGALIEWSACVESYPLTNPIILGCYDQNGANANGDGLGFVDLDGDITIDQSIVRYNQQDGLDALYVKSGKTLTVTNSQFYANNGQQIKTGGAERMIVRNNVIIGNCDRQREIVDGVTAEGYNTFEKSFCRAGDMAALVFKNGSSMWFENNTLVTYHPTAFNLQCRSITDVFNAQGRSAWDGSVDATLVPDGERRVFTTSSPIEYMGLTGAIWRYPAGGRPREAQRAGIVGEATCYGGVPCQYWYKPNTNTFYQDPSVPPLQPGDELRVEYYSAGYCKDASMSFKNNIVRGYPRPQGGYPSGAFWIFNFPTDGIMSPARRSNNLYCGLKPFVSGPTETVWKDCPGNFFVSEPANLTKEADLDNLDLHLAMGSPAIDAGVNIEDETTDFEGTARNYGARIDVGAYELAPLAGPPSEVKFLTAGTEILVYWNWVPGATRYEVQRRTNEGAFDETITSMRWAHYLDSAASEAGYCYRVRAVNAMGATAWSQDLCATRGEAASAPQQARMIAAQTRSQIRLR
jgi:hypothetical protein